jgi:hydrogenase nickel incorporation protein HypB
MCTTCGCGSDETTIDGAASHDDHHTHDHPAYEHDHHHHKTRTVSLERDILAKNRFFAERNRGWFAGREVLAASLISSPGAGRTSITRDGMPGRYDWLTKHHARAAAAAA